MRKFHVAAGFAGGKRRFQRQIGPPFLNHSGAEELNRVGYAFPQKIKYTDKRKGPVNIGIMAIPYQTVGLEDNVKFSRGQKLNNRLQPSQSSGVLLMRNTFDNNLYTPGNKNYPIYNKQFSTVPKKDDNLQSSVGLGFGIFDPILKE